MTGVFLAIRWPEGPREGRSRWRMVERVRRWAPLAMAVPVAARWCRQSSPRQNPRPSTGFSRRRLVDDSRRWLRTRAGLQKSPPAVLKGGDGRIYTSGVLEFAGYRFFPNRVPRRCLMEILRRRALAGNRVWLQSREEAEASLAAKDPTMSWSELVAAGSTSSSSAKSFGASSRRLVASGFLRSSEANEGGGAPVYGDGRRRGHPSCGSSHNSSRCCCRFFPSNFLAARAWLLARVVAERHQRGRGVVEGRGGVVGLVLP